MPSTQSQTYTRVAILLHWVIAILILAQLIGGKVIADKVSDPVQKFKFLQMHKSFGITVLILSAIRILWRLRHKPPALPETVPVWQDHSAKVLQWGLYFLMFALPLSGWMMVSASPLAIPTKLFGFVPWPDLPGVARSADTAKQFNQYHHYFAIAMVVLLLGHIGAALHHYLIGKDRVLTQIAPWIKPRAQAPKKSER